MFKDKINVQAIGTLKITDKETGTVLVDKRNAIHPGNMAYILASALAGQPTSIDSSGDSPRINWMAFGNGGSSSTTTLSYRSPRVFTTYDELPITSSNSTLYAKTYQQEPRYDVNGQGNSTTVYAPGQKIDPQDPNSDTIPENTAKVNFKVTLNHSDYADMVGETVPDTDSADPNSASVKAFTFDEIGLLAGVTTVDNNNKRILDETKTLMITHVTFHPVLLSANRTIVIDYTITIQLS